MAALGSLVVSLAMDTAKFSGAIGKSQQQMARLAQQAGKMGAAIGATVTAAAGTAAVLVRAAITAADANTKAAQAAGVTTEAYTQLGYAANLSGGSAESMGNALKKLAKNAVDAQAGTGDAKDAFEALGISVTDGNGALKSQEKILAEVADKFSTYKDGAEKTALAQRILGKAGAEMIPMLNQGSAGIQKMRDEAVALGISMDTKTGQAAERFNDNLTRLSSVGGGLANRVARELLPTLEGLTDRLVESAKSSGLLDKVARAAATGLRLLMSAGVIVGAVFKTLGEYAGAVAATLVQLASGEFRQAWNTINAGWTDMVDNVKGAADTLDGIWNDAADRVSQQAEANAEKLAAPLIKAAGKSEKALAAIREHLKQQRLLMLGGVSGYGENESNAETQRLERYNDAIVESTHVTIQQLAALDAYKKAQQDLLLGGVANFNEDESSAETARLARYADAVIPVNDAMAKMAENAKRASERIQDHLGDTLGRLLKGEWDNIGRMFGDLLKQMAAEALAADLMHAIFGKGTGGNFSSLLSGLGSFFGFGGGRASGGSVKRGTTYLVGERGPELFTPGSSGAITPNHALGSGATITLAPVIRIDARSDQAQVAQMVAAGMETSQRMMWGQLKARGMA